MRLLLPLKPAQGPQLPARQWMDRLGAALEPPDMQAAMGEVDGVPAQRHQLGRPQAVPVGDQHHGGIAVAVAIPPGSIDQAGYLAIGQILARADLGVARFSFSRFTNEVDIAAALDALKSALGELQP